MWHLDADAAVPTWRPDSGPAPAMIAFSTRRGGVSAAPFDTLNLGRATGDDPRSVSANRRALLQALGLEAASIATAGQVHGARVAEVETPGHHPGVDALLTRVPGLALAVTTADCVPIILTAPGAVCDYCSYLSTSTEPECPICDGTMQPIQDIVDHLVHKAVEMEVEIAFVSDPALEEAGSIGAVWRF